VAACAAGAVTTAAATSAVPNVPTNFLMSLLG
jgi:hypothetical protein